MTNEREQRLRELDALQESGRELEGFEPIPGRVSRSPRAVVSVRLGSAELKEIAETAGVLGRNVSEFIRDAALKEARIARAGINEAREAARSRASR